MLICIFMIFVNKYVSVYSVLGTVATLGIEQ